MLFVSIVIVLFFHRLLNHNNSVIIIQLHMTTIITTPHLTSSQLVSSGITWSQLYTYKYKSLCTKSPDNNEYRIKNITIIGTCLIIVYIMQKALSSSFYKDNERKIKSLCIGMSELTPQNLTHAYHKERFLYKITTLTLLLTSSH